MEVKMKQVNSVLDFANGAMTERINYELIKVMENIKNPNTDEKPRKLTVEITISPINNRQAVSLQTVVKKKLSPTSAVHTQMAIQTMGDRIAGYELTGIPDGQPDLFGEIHETKYVELKQTKTEEDM